MRYGTPFGDEDEADVMKRIGLIVNPVAGIGGKVGLKGSDGEEICRRALSLGAVRESGQKALAAVRLLKEVEDRIEICTCPGEMGANICEAAGLKYRISAGVRSGVSDVDRKAECAEGEGTGRMAGGVHVHTTSEDTAAAAGIFLDEGVDLILFAGGDGTARDIMDAVGTEAVVLGILAGCKIHSGVYALNPRGAGELAVRYVKGAVRDTREAEVMDIDEAEFRKGRVQSRLYGYLRIPDEKQTVQRLKSGCAYRERDSIECLAEYITEMWEPRTLYIVGSGSTMAAVMKKKGLPNTLLGVDLVYEDRVIAKDCAEKDILRIMEQYEKRKILVTVIGGQGYISGRGNQQISAEVIRRTGRENIIVAASPDKMAGLVGRALYADTGDEEVNQYLAGYMRVITGYGESAVIRVSV